MGPVTCSSSSLGKSVGHGHLGEASNLGSSRWATKMMRGDFKRPEFVAFVLENGSK